MKNIAIIPARGGSKRIPNKNIKQFFGRPVISYAIRTALESKIFDTVMVSTDSIEIRDIAISYNAEVPFLRSAKSSGDRATIVDVVEEVISEYTKKGTDFDYGCCLYPISPLTDIKILKKGFDTLHKDNLHSVLPLQKTPQPIERSFKKDQNNRLQIMNLEAIPKMSQDFTPSYFDTGQFIWFNVKKSIELKALVSSHSSGIVLSELQFQDVIQLRNGNYLR